MLFPKFTIRQMLLMMVGIGVLSACMAGASRGSAIAFGLATSMIASLLPFLALAVVYWLAWTIASLCYRSDGEAETSPNLVTTPGENVNRQAPGQTSVGSNADERENA